MTAQSGNGIDDVPSAAVFPPPTVQISIKRPKNI
jgi:hypothetical protein